MSESHRILVVDDDDMIRDVVCRMLKLKGHNPEVASSGDLALRKLSQDSDFGYIILDLNMPGKYTGEETFYKIQESYNQLKVIISTGFIDSNTATKFRSNGVHAILEKPYRIDDLLALF
jgi:DNA-binding NtrC family response regulator